jgi:hypothetical protein
VKERVLEVRGSTDTSTGLLIGYALTLRGIAMELGQVLSYTAHEQLIAFSLANILKVIAVFRSTESGGPTSRIFDRCKSSREQKFGFARWALASIWCCLAFLFTKNRSTTMPLPSAACRKRGAPSAKTTLRVRRRSTRVRNPSPFLIQR